MNPSSEPFVHVLLFECPECFRPVSSAIATSERNLENTDGRSFVIHCECGWTGNLLGLKAKRHWVDERS
jgi:hypothetical protein